MSGLHVAAGLHLKLDTIGDEREALLILLDFLLGSSIDEIASARHVRSRNIVEDGLRLVLLKYGFKAAQAAEP